MRRYRKAALALAGLLVVVAGLYLTRPGHAPEGQAPLTVIDGQTIAALKEDFNRAAGNTRIIVLLSPT